MVRQPLPAARSSATCSTAQRLLAELGERDPMLARKLKEANDDLQRALACRAFDARG
ncbi:MAG: hypothetical protein U0531_10025 [Dehalococcoidia bacterium]